MARRIVVTADGPTRRFLQCTLVLLVLCLCLGGCAQPPSEFIINSPRYDAARALWVIGRMHAGGEASAAYRWYYYEALYNRAAEALTADELDSIEAAFADMKLEDVFNLLARFDPRDDKWLEPAGAAASDSDRVKLIRLAWDRFLRDWDARQWRALRVLDLAAFDRQLPFTDNPFVLVPRWFDAPLPEPHVLFYMPAPYVTSTYFLRIDAGYAMVGDSVVRGGRTPALAEHVVDTNWFLDLDTEETNVLATLAQHTDLLETAAETREAIIHILYDAVLDRIHHTDVMTEHLEKFWAESGWPGLVAALQRRIDATWAAGKKLTEQDVWSVLTAWVAHAGN